MLVGLVQSAEDNSKILRAQDVMIILPALTWIFIRFGAIKVNGDNAVASTDATTAHAVAVCQLNHGGHWLYGSITAENHSAGRGKLPDTQPE